jgi:hypothetical protein
VNEAEWLGCTDPQQMLEALRGKASERKLRLFAVACCRRLRGVQRGKNRQVLDAAEEFADGRIGREEMEERRGRWYTFDYPFPMGGTWQAALSSATITHAIAAAVNETASHAARASDRPERERQLQAGFLHDIFGNPFRSVFVDPSVSAWEHGTVVRLANAAYGHRALPSGYLDNARLGVLADALEEAGVTDDAVLSHLRGPGPHVRGCWLVDLVTGRE